MKSSKISPAPRRTNMGKETSNRPRTSSKRNTPQRNETERKATHSSRKDENCRKATSSHKNGSASVCRRVVGSQQEQQNTCNEENPKRTASDSDVLKNSEHGDQNSNSETSQTSSHSINSQNSDSASKTVKKKAGRIVQSRYKDAASRAAKPSIPRSISLERIPVSQSGRKEASLSDTIKRPSTPVSGSDTALNTTPFPWTDSVSTGTATSTPAINLVTAPGFVHDESSIVAEQSHNPPLLKSSLAPPPPSVRPKLKGHAKSVNSMQSTQGPVAVLLDSPGGSRASGTNDDNITRKDLKIVYCRYLQAKHLEMMAEKAFNERSEKAMRQICMLSQMNRELAERAVQLETQLETFKYLKSLKHCLDVQEESLSPVVYALPTLDTQYCRIADTVDTTRHGLPTSNVIFPKNGEEEERVLEALEETGSLLAAINAQLETSRGDLYATTSGLRNIYSILEGETNDLQKNNNLISQLSSLVTRESSLKIQTIQELGEV
ncbi:uncharacterized protein LOC143223769 [Tachypleus tridentatus]|uniref:uncharacterized protein LOC143223769 n=1 Tax=Tachypleus tridentatus TaxID=6853 RepID=UPI003FD14654